MSNRDRLQSVSCNQRRRTQKQRRAFQYRSANIPLELSEAKFYAKQMSKRIPSRPQCSSPFWRAR